MDNWLLRGRILITGGCGFIGSNLAVHYLNKGWEVVVFDNFSRPGAEVNAAWLESLGNGNLAIMRGDVRDLESLRVAMQGAYAVAHLAAQTAVTTSVKDPLLDFNINALGGLLVLEAARSCDPPPHVVYASTNKVYGEMKRLHRTDGSLRYYFPEYPEGIPEDFPIDLHSPYGCSKGASDLYMLDYARIYDLKTVVFRQSCIYGPRQFGVEDQGWVAHFVISALLGRPITIYGDGRQVRDILHVHDLIEAIDRALERLDRCQGQAYNLGGGRENAISLLELVYRLEAKLNRPIPISFREWRPGDQRLYVSDVRKAKRDLDWQPVIDIDHGLDDICQWVEANMDLVQSVIDGCDGALPQSEQGCVVPSPAGDEEMRSKVDE